MSNNNAPMDDSAPKSSPSHPQSRMKLRRNSSVAYDAEKNLIAATAAATNPATAKRPTFSATSSSPTISAATQNKKRSSTSNYFYTILAVFGLVGVFFLGFAAITQPHETAAAMRALFEYNADEEPLGYCGDGVLSPNEECECPTFGDVSCGECSQCKLTSPVECSTLAVIRSPKHAGLIKVSPAMLAHSQCCVKGSVPAATQCCADNSNRPYSSSQCKSVGVCSLGGTCSNVCSDLSYDRTKYIPCGVSPNGCRQKCQVGNGGACTGILTSTKGDLLNAIQDGSKCPGGLCHNGECFAITSKPSAEPTSEPTSEPSASPTTQPTTQAPAKPSKRPTSDPTRKPSKEPISTQGPTFKVTSEPTTVAPTSEPTAQPTLQPTTLQPTTREPTSKPSTLRPTAKPTTAQPTVAAEAGVQECNTRSTPESCALDKWCAWYEPNICNYLANPVVCRTINYGCQSRPLFCNFNQGTALEQQMACNNKGTPCVWNKNKQACLWSSRAPTMPPSPHFECYDTCLHSLGDGICQDGGPGSKGVWCPLGTDCKDCGPRWIE